MLFVALGLKSLDIEALLCNFCSEDESEGGDRGAPCDAAVVAACADDDSGFGGGRLSTAGEDGAVATLVFATADAVKKVVLAKHAREREYRRWVLNNILATTAFAIQVFTQSSYS